MVTFVTVYNVGMNARDYKTFRAGCTYHVYNRGDNRELVFIDEQDYFNFLKRIKIILGRMSVPRAGQRGALRLRPLPPNSFSIFAYCLMPNHFHFLIRQNGEAPIGDFIMKLCTSYAKYFNRKYERLGNLFQDTFKAKIVDTDAYALYVSAYIHNNPAQPFEYAHSSLPDYIAARGGVICDRDFILGYCKDNRMDYKDFVSRFSGEDEQKIQDLLFEE